MTKVSELIRTKGHQVHGIQKDTPLSGAARAFMEKQVSSFLVYDGDKLVGIFTKNDLIRCCSLHRPELGDPPVSATMTTDLFAVPSSADLEDVFKETMRRGLHHVPVIDGDKAVGMLTPIDILIHQKSAASFENQELLRYISGSY